MTSAESGEKVSLAWRGCIKTGKGDIADDIAQARHARLESRGLLR